MSLTGRCIIGRTAKVALRRRGKRGPARVVTVAFPARWSRSTLLAYVRRHHPDETVRILEWHETHAKQPRVTHGRHCSCSACAREDWTRITVPCGMHGPDCPAAYAPIQSTLEPVLWLANPAGFTDYGRGELT